MAESAVVAGFSEGVPCWVDAQLPDVEAGKRFYGELFGWTFPEESGLSGWAELDGEPVAGLTPKRDGRMPTVWTVYFATPDAVALARRITEAGGRIITAPAEVGASGELGREALATDPEGAVFGLWQPGTHPGFGRRHERRTFCWAELYARDTATVDRFYGALFRDALFGPDATPDFGRVPVSGVFPAEMPPHFVVHFGVEDCEEALGTVNRLGGRVQVTPFDTSYGRVAVVTDNQGASFAVLER
ncbi:MULTISPECIES: VOC family protein [unclassified Streptomyces]|uniref:VOC family protein n=1 Tax=unclassified Streptomyces TaxID=2593676 RepID=UPI002258EE3A|nr:MULTISPECIES: VOC family protein [unclassified Streptomyces]MCX4990252.1 VOC family protein [Streptomyces sp. NBC_00568]MCX5004517.1 VOC family protein [Streptomyces sp. NBC_00638]